MEVPVTFREQKLIADVIHCRAGEPAFGLYPGSDEELDFELLSPSGTRLEWLENRLTDDDWEDIRRQIKGYWRRQDEIAQEQMAESRLEW